MPGDLEGVHLGVEFGELRPELVARVAELVASHAARRAEQLPAVDERPPLLERRQAPLQVGERPFRPRAAVLEEVVADLEGLGGQIGGRVGEVALQVVDHVHRPVHPPPMARVGADVGVDAGLRRHLEGDPLRGLRLEEGAGHEDVGRFRHEGALGEGGILGELLRRLPQGLHRARLGDDEVVGHDVGVLEHEQDRLPRLDGDGLLVVVHPLVDGADADDADAEVGKLRPPCLAFRRGEERGEVLGELPGGEAGVARTLLDARLLHRPQERSENRRGPVGGPLGHGDLLERRDRRVALDAIDDERRDPLEDLLLPAADAGQRREGRPAHRGGEAGLLARHRNLRGTLGGGLVLHAEDRVAAVVEDRERVALEAAGEAVAAVPDDDPLDGLRAAEIDLPPGILDPLLGVRLAPLGVFGVGVAIDAARGLAAGADVGLRRLAGAGDVVVAGEDLHLGEGQRPLLAGEIDADEPAHRARLHRGGAGEAVEERNDPVVEARTDARIAHQRQGLDEVDEPARVGLRQVPGLRRRVAAAEGVDRGERHVTDAA